MSTGIVKGEVPNPSPIRRAVTAVAVVIFVLILAFASLMLRACFYSPEERAEVDARSAQRDAIDRCRDAQNDQLQELSTRRVTRSTCDRMVSDYKERWGRDP